MFCSVRFLVFSGIALCILPASLRGEMLTDSKLGFSLELPAGAKPRPDLVGAKPDIVHVYQIGDKPNGQIYTLIFIEKMGGTIGREPIKAANMPAGFRGKILRKTWHEFTVDCVEVEEEVAANKAITYNVQIPLKHEAIQLRLFGGAENRVELDELLPRLIDGLNGESNWLKSAGPATLADSKDYGLILLAGAIAAVVVGVILLWLVSRWTPKGVLLAIAAGIYSAGWAIGSTRVQELLMLSGVLKMLGFIGGIMGIVDLCRTRKPKIQTAHVVDEHDPRGGG